MKGHKLILIVSILLLSISFIEGYSITTFSDGSSSGTLNFTIQPTILKNLSIPNYATITNATIDLLGLPLSNSYDGFEDGLGSWYTAESCAAGGSGVDYVYVRKASRLMNTSSTAAICQAGMLGQVGYFCSSPSTKFTYSGNSSWLLDLENTANDEVDISKNFTTDFSHNLTFATMYNTCTVGSFTIILNYQNGTEISSIFSVSSGISSDWSIKNINLSNYTTFPNLTIEFRLTSGNDKGGFVVIDDICLNCSYTENLTIRTNNSITYQISSVNSSLNNINLNATLLESCANLCYFPSGDNCLCEINFTAINGTITYSDINISINMGLDNCSVYSGLVINLTQQDENTLIDISPTNLEVEVTLTDLYGEEINYYKSTNETSLAVCAASKYVFEKVKVIAGYEATSYVKEFWYLDNGSIGNYFNSYTPNHVYLYDLPSTDSTTFLFKYTDEYGLEVDNAIIHTYRKYIGDGIYREVERSRQDDNGETHVHLIEEDATYYFMVTQEGVIKFISNTYNAKCLSSPCTLELKGTGGFTNFPPYSTINGSTFSTSTNKTSRISTLYYKSNASHVINFTIYRFDGSISYVNSSISTGSEDTISLKIPMEYGNMTYIGAIYQNGEFVKSEWIDLKPSGRELFGNTGAIMSGFIIMAFGLMAISEGPLLICAIVIILIALSLLFLVDLAWFTIMAITCAGGIIAWAIIKRKNG